MAIEGVRRGAAVRRRRSIARLAAGALLPLPLLAGCSGDDGGPTAAPATQDLASAVRDRVRDSGTVHWAIDAMPATLNTFQSDADAASDSIAGAVLPALFTIDRRGLPQRNPDYLKSADIVAREPKQVVVYTLEPEAAWSDGRAIGAEDFAAQWKALGGSDTAYWTARNAGYDRIEKVERGADRHEVKVTFRKPYADWRALFTPLYPKAVMGSADAFNDGSRRTLKATAGPFVIKKRDSERGSVTLVRNPRWWGDRAKLDRLVFDVVPREKRAAALAARKLDIAEIDGSTAQRIGQASKPGQKAGTGVEGGAAGAAAADSLTGGQAAADRSAEPSSSAAEQGRTTERVAGRTRRTAAALRDYTVRRALEPAYTQLALNGETGPLADERVRRAVARAIDRQEIADAVLKPAGLPAKALGSHLVMAGQQGYQDNSGALGKPGASVAQALLADAGWRPGGGGPQPKTAADQKAAARQERAEEEQAGKDGTAEERKDTAEDKDKDSGSRAGRPPASPVRKNGKPLTLRFVLPTGPGSEPLRVAGVRISEMLARIGIGTRIVRVEDESYFKDHIASGDFDLALYSWPATPYPATDARPIFAKPRPVADGSLVVEQNYPRVGTDQIDQLFDQAVAELDAGASRELVSRADARIWAAAGSVPLYQRPQLVAVRSDLVNAGVFGFATPRYQDIGFRR